VNYRQPPESDESEAKAYTVTELRLMAVHAHPDDESSKGAATTARYSAEGHRVLVVSLTGGERGDILNPAMDLPEVHGRIAEVRRDEMAKAAEILGVEHTWLGFVDSGLPEGDPPPPLPEGCFALVPLEEACARLVKVIREFRPHVMTTYDENGGYPHPDHIRCHQVSVAAYEAAADHHRFPDAGAPWSVSKLYYNHGFLRQRMQMLQDEFAKHGRVGPFDKWLEHWDPDHDVFADRSEPWLRRVESVALELRQRVTAHPGAVPLMLGAPMNGPRALALNERLLELLADIGLNTTDAARAAHLLFVYIFGSIALEVADLHRPGALAPESERVAARHRRYADVPAEHLPRTRAAAATLAGHISTDQYLWGLHRVLEC